MEVKYSLASYFVTLTYDDDHTDGNVWKRDCQLFFKRFRKIYTGKFKYFLCSEYGETTFRPHYHLHLFFCDLITKEQCYDYLKKAWMLDGKPLGQIQIGNTEEGSIWYTTKNHITKNDVPDGLNPCFNLMSKRPAIGSDYVDRMKTYHNSKGRLNRIFGTTCNGYKVALPRYYKEKLYSKLILQLHYAKTLQEHSELISYDDWKKSNPKRSHEDYSRMLIELKVNYERLLKKESKQARKL